MEITFNYGLTAKTLEEQANEKGYTFGANAEWVEKICYGLKCAFMHECITDSEYKKIIGRFSEKVLAKRLKKLDKVSHVKKLVVESEDKERIFNSFMSGIAEGLAEARGDKAE